MSGPDWIEKTKVPDGEGGKREVSVGDKVDLLPLTHEQAKEWNAGPNFRSMRDYLGEPPYTIGHIGLWPCGGINLYVKTRNGESGVEAKKFIVVD